MKKAASTLFILIAASLWGCMGIFVRHFNAAGLAAFDILQMRILPGLVFVGTYLAVFHREKLRVRIKELWCFFGTGICSLLFFSYCYFTGINEASLSVMSVLLYTAPAFVLLLSAIFFCEKLTAQKLLALGLTFAGCCLVSGLGGGVRLGARVLLLGLGAGFGYSLYSIFSRCAILRGYDSWTITFYTFVFCAAGGLFFTDWGAISGAVRADGTLVWWVLAMGFTTAFLAYLLYTRGLEGMESSRASILASVEPVVASVISVTVFHEALSAAQAAGILLVLSGVAVLSMKERQKA